MRKTVNLNRRADENTKHSKKKYTQREVQAARDFIRGQKNKQYTVLEVKAAINKACRSQSLSISTVRRIWEKSWIWVTNKLATTNKVNQKKDYLIKVVGSAYIQHICTKNHDEIIYFDEFSLSGRHYSLYGWVNRGKKGYIILDENPFQMSFIVGFSRTRFYGIMATDDTVDSCLVI